MLNKYKTIFWDFDGVIMDSMAVRDKGFEIVLKGYPKEEVSSLMHYHRENGGLSRYKKFRYFFEEIRKVSITDEEINVLAKDFSTVMLQNLLDKRLLIEDSLRFIKENYSKYNMHIVSGSDGCELRYICETLGLSQYFISIHGSPTPKNELVAGLLQERKYQKEETCLIGDSFNDLDACSINHISFLGYNNLKLINEGEYYIKSFFEF